AAERTNLSIGFTVPSPLALLRSGITDSLCDSRVTGTRFGRGAVIALRAAAIGYTSASCEDNPIVPMSSPNPLRLRPVALAHLAQGSGLSRRRRMIVTLTVAVCVAAAVALGVLGVHSPGAPRPATLILASHSDVAPVLPAAPAAMAPAPAA